MAANAMPIIETIEQIVKTNVAAVVATAAPIDPIMASAIPMYILYLSSIIVAPGMSMCDCSIIFFLLQMG